MKYLNVLIILGSILGNLSFAYEPDYYLTEGDLDSMQFSPDGSYLAVVLSTGLKLYHPDSGELLTELRQESPRIHSPMNRGG